MSLSLSLSVISPLCIYILVGVISTKLGWIDTVTATKMNHLTYKLFFPILTFNNMLSAGKSFNSSFLHTIWFMMLALTVLFVLLMVFVPLFVKDRKRQGSFIQASYRGNTLLFALPIVQTICGTEAAATASVCMAVLIPFGNIFCVIALEIKRGGSVNVKEILKGIATNPLIIAAALGALFLLLKIEIPSLLAKPLGTMASMVTPLSLVLLGVGLKIKGFKSDAGHLLSVCAIKLLLFPIATVVAARAFGFTGADFATIFAMSCVPTAVSSFTLAEAMGADGPFAGEAVAVTTILSLLTVFIWVIVLSSMGMFI